MRQLRASLVALAACGGAAHNTAAPAPTPAPAPAAAAPAPVRATMAPAATATRVRELGGITEYRLSNGLSVLLFPDPSQADVTVNITYLVGSRVEGYGETGMAHLLEHMTFKGTPRHRNIMKLVGDRGGNVNGSTWTDRTNYFETLPGTAANLDWMLDLEADRMVGCPIAADDLETEFSVVRNELESDENDPERVLDARLMSTAYLWHNYGKDTIGSRSDVERVPADRLRAFYQRWYQPDDAVLVVAGRFDGEAALSTIIRTFGAIPRPARTLDATYTVEPVQDGEREVTLRRAGKVSVVGVLYHTVAGSAPEYAVAAAALDVLTRDPSGLLYKQLVATHKASRVWGYGYQFKEPSVGIVMAEVPDAKNVAAVEQTLTAAIEGLGATRIDPAAVERWRNAAIKDLDLREADVTQSALQLSEYAALGDWRMAFAWRDQVKAVTPDAVAKLARDYFKRSNRTLGRFVPTADADRAPPTETPDVEKIADAATAPDTLAGEAFDPTIENIEAHLTRTTIGGLQVALLPKKTRAGKVVVALKLQWGDAASLAGKREIAQLADRVIHRGTAVHDLQAIRDLEDKLGARIWISVSPSGAYAHLETFRDRLPAALDLFAEELTRPSFPAAELEVARAERIAQLGQDADDPGWRSSIELSRRLHPWPATDVRYTPTIDEQIAAAHKVTAADLRGFWRDFAGAGHGELAVVGDFDPDAVTAQLGKALAGWTSKKPYTRLDDHVFDVAGSSATIDTPDKENAELRVESRIAMKEDDADYPAWLMLGRVFGEGGGSRVWMRLREHEGLSYGAWGWTDAGTFDEVGSFGAGAIVAPQNLAHARKSMLDEIGKLLTLPITGDELTRARDGWTQDFARELADDDRVSNLLVWDLYDGRTFAWRSALEAKVRALAPADLDAVARKDLHPDQLIVVLAGDQKKAAAKPAP